MHRLEHRLRGTAGVPLHPVCLHPGADCEAVFCPSWHFPQKELHPGLWKQCRSHCGDRERALTTTHGNISIQRLRPLGPLALGLTFLTSPCPFLLSSP